MKRLVSFSRKENLPKKSCTNKHQTQQQFKASFLDFIVPKKNTECLTQSLLQPSKIKHVDIEVTERKIACLSDSILTMAGQVKYAVENNNFTCQLGGCSDENYLNNHKCMLKQWTKANMKITDTCKTVIQRNGIVVDAQNLMFSTLTGQNVDLYKGVDANEKAVSCFLAFENSLNTFSNLSKIKIVYVFKDFARWSKLSVEKISQLLENTTKNDVSVIKYQISSLNVIHANGDDILALYVASGKKSVLLTNDKIDKVEDQVLIKNDMVLYYNLIYGKDPIVDSISKKCVRCY